MLGFINNAPTLQFMLGYCVYERFPAARLVGSASSGWRYWYIPGSIYFIGKQNLNHPYRAFVYARLAVIAPRHPLAHGGGMVGVPFRQEENFRDGLISGSPKAMLP